MTSSIQACDAVFPGYLLVERIGTGGYAEVWRARAPGGIDKAIKIIYGYSDDQLAAQEMKAMERIKDVRHPFVLSLERFEVVDGRLLILTELADMSLEQRAQHYRAQGSPGIPRAELLGFLADTAEALDYLAERHGLLHLDIKPANLLISGDHVKVADFGLVKELASRTQNSMVAGMTPTYSSPELFDDAPSTHSDQYSLAIVYQEMLTGTLPFPGRTTAQLANQHIRAQPQLSALSPHDRKAVAKALAKIPAERFGSCRAFVKALDAEETPPANRDRHEHDAQERAGTGLPDRACAPVTARPRSVSDRLSPRSPLGAATATVPTQVQSLGMTDTKVEPKFPVQVGHGEEFVDVVAPDVAAAVERTHPTLYVAVGGIGIRILSRLRDLLAGRTAAALPSLHVEMIAIDTDRAALADAGSTIWSSPLPASDALHLSLRLPQEYREREQDNLEWLSHRWLYNIPRSLETRGYRPLGRLALVDHVDQALSLIDAKLRKLAAMHLDECQPHAPRDFRVVLVAGTGGGTGSGMAIDLANAVRSRVEAVGSRGELLGILVCTCLGKTNPSPLSVANTYALLTELQYTTVFGCPGANGESSGSQSLMSDQRPFDLVYCVPAARGAEESVDQGLDLIAHQLSLAWVEGARQMLQCCQLTPTPRELAGTEPLLLRTFAGTSLAAAKQTRLDRLTTFLSDTIEQHWLGDVGAGEWRRLIGTEGADIQKLKTLRPSASAEICHVAPRLSTTQIERWRHSFGEHASTRLAYEVVSRIRQQSVFHGACRKTLFSSKDPAGFVEQVAQAVSPVCKRAASKLQDRPFSDDELIINALAQCSQSVLRKLLDEFEKASAESPFDATTMDRIITAECAAVVKEYLGQQPTGGTAGSNSVLRTELQQALEVADVGLLQCGCDRRTLMIVPASQPANEAIAVLNDLRPTAAVVSADIDEPVVFCEGSGISPSCLARGLERVYPGIAQVASRFLTRIDIDWFAGLK